MQFCLFKAMLLLGTWVWSCPGPLSPARAVWACVYKMPHSFQFLLCLLYLTVVSFNFHNLIISNVLETYLLFTLSLQTLILLLFHKCHHNPFSVSQFLVNFPFALPFPEFQGLVSWIALKCLFQQTWVSRVFHFSLYLHVLGIRVIVFLKSVHVFQLISRRFGFFYKFPPPTPLRCFLSSYPANIMLSALTCSLSHSFLVIWNLFHTGVCLELPGLAFTVSSGRSSGPDTDTWVWSWSPALQKQT